MLPASFTPEQREAVEEYRRLRDRYRDLGRRADEAFARWFSKRQAGKPTNGAQASRLGNEQNYVAADMFSAQGRLYALDIDPWDVDDADRVERTPVM